MYLVGVGSFSHFSMLSVIELFFFTFPLNFFLYGLNDVYDAKSDRINTRKEEAQGIVPEDEEIKFLKKVVYIPPVIFLAITLFSHNLEHVLLSIVFCVLSFTYSHRSTRFKEIPVLDCFNSGAIYCVPALIAYSLQASILTLPATIFLIIIPMMGIHATTTLADEKVDAAAGMATIGVVFKKTGTILFSILMFVITVIAFRHSILLVSASMVSILLEIILLFSRNKDDVQFRFAIGAVLVSFGMLSLIYYILAANS